VILLWMEKAPPIITSPSLDSRGNSGLSSISQRGISSFSIPNPNRIAMKASPVMAGDIFILVDYDGEEPPKLNMTFIISLSSLTNQS